MLYKQHLETQKTIFRNECHLLLDSLGLGRELARQMLKDKTHTAWTDHEFDERFARHLGDTGQACEFTIKSMKDKLKAIEEKLERFGLVLQESIPVSSISKSRPGLNVDRS